MSDVAPMTYLTLPMMALLCLSTGLTACDDGDGAVGPLGDADLRAVSARLALCFQEPLALHFEELETAHRAQGAIAVAVNRRNACILQAADCMGVASCFGYSDAPCDDEDRCAGSVKVRCGRHPITGDMVRSTEDCADDPHGNVECALGDGGGPRCAAPAAVCENREQVSCDGDTHIECYDLPRIRQCDLFSGRCDIGLDGCVRADFVSPCTPCQGDVAYECEDGGWISNSFDCGVLDMQCEPTEVYDDNTQSASIVGRCVTPTPSCERSSCDGATASLCVEGQPFDFECPLGGECVIFSGTLFCAFDPPPDR